MLEWKRGGEWCITAEHNGQRYTISKALIVGEPRYTGWLPDGTRLVTRKSLEEAKADILERINEQLS